MLMMNPPVKHDSDSDSDDDVPNLSSGGGAPASHACPHEGCAKTFSRLHNLKSHLKTHTPDKPFGCAYCSLAFRRNHDLKRHMRLHTDDRPYVCGGCGKGFGRSDALRRHNKVDDCPSSNGGSSDASPASSVSATPAPQTPSLSHPVQIPLGDARFGVASSTVLF
ncbi:hypothetical protein BC829DRAFT_368754 [Chytridium lagenaria]|nr:hypothetical protein BC829DRAFT_368754 [Chytridium lagenaria]